MKFILVSLLLLAFSSCTSTHGHRHVASDHSHGDGEHHYHESDSKFGHTLPDDPMFCDLNKNGITDESEMTADNICKTKLKTQGLFSKASINVGSLGLKKGELILTIDDGPRKGVTGPILKLLRRYNIKAVFFLTGNRMKNNAGLVKEILKEGHTIANHTYSHTLTKNPEKLRRDILQGHKTLVEVLGYEPEGRMFFRAPGLGWSSAKAIRLNQDKKVRTFIGPISANLGVDHDEKNNPNWAADWACWSRRLSAEQCATRYFKEIITKSKGIILAHDIYYSSKVPKRNTYEMLRILLARLDRAGGIGPGKAWVFKGMEDNPHLDRLDVEKLKDIPAGWKDFSDPNYRLRSSAAVEYQVLDKRSLIKVSGGRDLKTGDVIYYKFLGEYKPYFDSKGVEKKLAKVKIMQALPAFKGFEGAEVYVGTGAL